MRLTRIGLGAALAALLTLLSALSSGNNLLYLLYSQIVAGLLVAWFAGRLNVRGVRAAALDDRAVRSKPVELPFLLRNEERAPRLFLRLRGAADAIARLDAGRSARVFLRFALPHRGVNRLDGLHVESPFPFGFWTHSSGAGTPELVGLPDPPPGGRGAAGDGEGDAGAGPRPGSAGDEFHGARPYDRSDDPRAINWKLTARTGAVFVNEYRAPGGGRRTVRLEPAADAEAAVLEAAAACRAGIEAESEVRLITPEREIPYGRGRGHLERMLEALALTGEGARARPAPPPQQAPERPADDAALRWATGIGNAWVYASLFLIDEIRPAALAALVPLLLLGFYLEKRRGPWPPRRLLDLVSGAVLVYSIAFGWRVSGVTVATTHLVAYLLVNRALSPLHDDCAVAFVIQFLAFFLASGQTISLWYFAAFVGYVAYAAVWLTLAHGARWSERATWRAGAWRAGAAAAACGAVLFALTPRVEPRGELNPVAAIGLDRLKQEGPSVVGFSESVTLGYFGPLKRSAAKALRISPIPPPAGKPEPVLVRGAAYETFDGRRWTRAPARFRFRRGGRVERAADGRAWSAPDGGAQRLSPAGGPETAYDVSIFPMNGTALFSVGAARAVSEESSTGLYMDHLDSAYFAQPYSGGVRYRVTSGADGSGLWASLLDSKPLVERLLRLPEGIDPRVADLARRAAGNAASDAERVARVAAFLRGGYGYSLAAEDGRSTLEDFLFRTRRGNCEYFATAAAILLRTLGVPTRLVTGFAASEWNEYGRFFDVRQSAAHAWTEALVGGRWVTVDATPSGGESLVRTFGERLGKYWDALEARWYLHVIGYDRFAQRNTFLRVGRRLGRLPELPWRRIGRRAGAAAAVLAALAGLGWALRRRAPPGIFERAERLLRRAALRRDPSETPLEFARTAASQRPSLRPLVALAELDYRERFGPGLSPADRSRAETLLAALREGLLVK